MEIIKSRIFSQFPEIIFGVSPRKTSFSEAPFFFNMSLSAADNPAKVIDNRNIFFESLGLNINSVAVQFQIHSDLIQVVSEGGDVGESDAIITNKFNLGLAISAADCVPVFIYDRANKVIAGVHSGWRGAKAGITAKTLNKLYDDFNSSPENLFAFVGPSISVENYEVGAEVAAHFRNKYIKTIGNKIHLDVSAAVYDSIVEFGVPENQIERSPLCTFENEDLLHSYRRDGNKSGRSLGVIAMRR